MSKVSRRVNSLLKDWSKQPQLPIANLTAEIVRIQDRAVQELQDPLEAVGMIKEYKATTTVGHIPIRIYTPKRSKKNKSLPVFIFFHGGGFVIGSESYEAPIRRLTNTSECIICSVEYSLAPESKFPTAANEAIAATNWIVENAPIFNGDKNKIAIGGDSSGGNLAVTVVLNNKQHFFKQLVLIYPMLDATCSQPSVDEFSTDYGFTKEKMEWYFDQYLPKNIDRKQQNVSPLFAKDVSNFPKTFIATAQCDPIRDEAELFGHQLKEAGVTVHTKRYNGMIHGFFQMYGVLNQGKILIQDIANQLQQNLK